MIFPKKSGRTAGLTYGRPYISLVHYIFNLEIVRIKLNCEKKTLEAWQITTSSWQRPVPSKLGAFLPLWCSLSAPPPPTWTAPIPRVGSMRSVEPHEASSSPVTHLLAHPCQRMPPSWPWMQACAGEYSAEDEAKLVKWIGRQANLSLESNWAWSGQVWFGHEAAALRNPAR